MKYRAQMVFMDGEIIDSYDDYDETEFDTKEEAEEFTLEMLNNYNTGCEVLHMSNPGDNPAEWEDPFLRVVEVEE